MGIHAQCNGVRRSLNMESALESWTVKDLSRPARLQDILPLLAGDWIPSNKGCKKAIERGRVLLNAAKCDTGNWVHNGDLVTLLQAKLIPSVAIPVPIQIGYQDDAVVVVWKPAGLHTSGSHKTSLRAQVAGMMSPTPKLDYLTHPEPAHRLDYATSGWVIFGRTSYALNFLNNEFKNERIRKYYLAVVHGNSPEKLKINLPLENKPASTFATCWARGPIPTRGEGSLLHITTGTGRTHQIRKHLHSIHHGIVGDDRYKSEQHFKGHGLLLCAYQIEFQHPTSTEWITLKGEVPRKFNRFRWVKNLL